MPGNFSKPVVTDGYVALLQYIRENFTELAKALDASTATSLPTGAVRFNSTTRRWEKWNGSAWSELVAKATQNYDMRVAQADDVVVGASTAKGLGQLGPAVSSSGANNANAYITSGAWFIGTVDMVWNWPVAVGGHVFVSANAGGTYLRQTFFVFNANAMYSRYSTDSGATWSTWKHVTADANWNALAGADGFIANKPTLGSAAAAAKQSSVLDNTDGALMMVGAFGLGGGGNVYNGNLNAIAATSFYFAGSSATNRPVAINGHCITVAYTADYAVQSYYPNNVNYGYMRTRSSGSWGAWSRIFTGDSILGTVSQSGGVPAGAMIERGSNANGEYVRFADGTQICTIDATDPSFATTADGAVFRGNSAFAWTFPANFASVTGLACGANAQSDGGRWFNCRIVNTTSATISRFSTASDSLTRTFRAFAIGRWF